MKYSKLIGNNIEVSPSRTCKGEVCIWQRRFWEHQIRDEKDLQRHVDYIHYNPVKHNLIQKVEDWPWSTYHKFVMGGFYGQPDDFMDVTNIKLNEFGE